MLNYNKNTKQDSQNWFDNNPFFHSKEDYDAFVEAMIAAAAEENLPIALQHDEPETITTDDIRTLSHRFKQDTGLYIEFKLLTCNHCDKLHCLIIVDENPEEMEGDLDEWNEVPF